MSHQFENFTINFIGCIDVISDRYLICVIFFMHVLCIWRVICVLSIIFFICLVSTICAIDATWAKCFIYAIDFKLNISIKGA